MSHDEKKIKEIKDVGRAILFAKKLAVLYKVEWSGLNEKSFTQNLDILGKTGCLTVAITPTNQDTYFKIVAYRTFWN